MVRRFHLSLPIPQSFLETKFDTQIPFLRVRSWMEFLIQNNCSHIFSGVLQPNLQREGDIWASFWKQYEVQNPSHPIFERARSQKVNLRNCIGILLHGDEGRTKKRSAFLVLNFHSILGRGVAATTGGYKRRYLKLLPNFMGHSYTNRFLVSALPKRDYTGPRSSVFDILLQTVAEELAYVANVGVEVRGQRYFAFCLGIVGDWPWLAKCGLDRSFLNVSKHKEPNGNEAGPQRVCRGICHLCNAGQAGWPYEQIGTRSPTWEASVLALSPFGQPSPFAVIPHPRGQLPCLYRFDLFHCWHLGMGKNFLGSILVVLSEKESAGSCEGRFEQLTEKYLKFCKDNHLPAHTQRITRDHLNWPSSIVITPRGDGTKVTWQHLWWNGSRVDSWPRFGKMIFCKRQVRLQWPLTISSGCFTMEVLSFQCKKRRMLRTTGSDSWEGTVLWPMKLIRVANVFGWWCRRHMPFTIWSSIWYVGPKRAHASIPSLLAYKWTKTSSDAKVGCLGTWARNIAHSEWSIDTYNQPIPNSPNVATCWLLGVLKMCLENHWSTLKYDKQKFHIIATLTILILLQLRTGGSVTKILGIEQRFASAGAVVVGRQFWKPRVSKKTSGFF